VGTAAVVAALIALAVPGAAAPQFGNLVVDTTADGNDGECNNDCTLREAIALADPNQGQWVSLRPGVYRLTLGPLVPQNDIVFGVSFTGQSSSGARTTVIDARGAGRAVEVPAGSTAVLAGLTVTGGNAPSGGAVFIADGAQLSLYDTILRGNVATGRGGAIHNGGSLAVFHSTLSGNRAAAGGAIAGDAASNVGVFYSTLSGNTASSTGGGLSMAGGAQLQRVTIAGNTAPTGGGLYVESPETGNVAMWSTLFADNSSACGGFTSQRFPWAANLSDDASCAFEAGQGTVVGDPRLGALGNNGGPTDTRALLAGSAAINTGDQSLCSAGSPDQRHAPSTDACDIGAFEFGARPPEPQLPPPVAGETVNANRSRGSVKVKLPGSDEFFDLEQAQQVPVGSTFDTSKGRVNLVAAGSQKSWFYQGVFRLGQSRGARPLSTLTLTGRLVCGGGNRAIAAAKKKRRLWGDGKGKFRTKGKHSAATVVGTRWLVEDRCNGTLTRVARGKVRVRDGKRTIRLRAGQKYFARAK
jgi:CSLREA domain-containing protein